MSATQNIFRTILYNNLLEDFQINYTADDLKEMYKLDDDEAEELYFFIQLSEKDSNGMIR